MFAEEDIQEFPQHRPTHQWGRDLTVAESLAMLIGLVKLFALQWGRDSDSLALRPALQWGRDLTVADG